MYDLGAFPGVVPSDNEGDMVSGEVLEMSDPEKTLDILDAYEGTPHLYRRELIKSSDVEGVTPDFWVYIYNRDVSGLTAIEDGVWE